MKKVLWIMNKYVRGDKAEKYYPYFLKYLQDELVKNDCEMHFVFFSKLMKKSIIGKNNHFFNSGVYEKLNDQDIDTEARRIEKKYAFTFKQAWFPDILQVSKKQNGRKISVPEIELNDLRPLVKKFLYIESLIISKNINTIFSDVSPEAEMEFGRAIGQKHNIPVLKSYEGSFLGRTILLQHTKFGKDQLVEYEIHKNYSIDDAAQFLNDFIDNKRPPYLSVQRFNYKESLLTKIARKIKSDKKKIAAYSIKLLWKPIYNFWLWFESSIIKQFIYDEFEPDRPYLFFGFHLNQESTMGLRSMPYVNQAALVEILSRVLPYGYTLYVREHPHWPKTFPVRYLRKCKSYPNVRLLSPKISIHDIIKDSRGVLVYNSNTGIEALMYSKPVLSFASNIYYKHHPAVLHCSDSYELGAKLSELINLTVNEEDTYKYLKKMMGISIDLVIGSYFFLSEEDSRKKAIKFSKYLIGAIAFCKRYSGK